MKKSNLKTKIAIASVCGLALIGGVGCVANNKNTSQNNYNTEEVNKNLQCYNKIYNSLKTNLEKVYNGLTIDRFDFLDVCDNKLIVNFKGYVQGFGYRFFGGYIDIKEDMTDIEVLAENIDEIMKSCYAFNKTSEFYKNDMSNCLAVYKLLTSYKLNPVINDYIEKGYTLKIQSAGIRSSRADVVNAVGLAVLTNGDKKIYVEFNMIANAPNFEQRLIVEHCKEIINETANIVATDNQKEFNEENSFSGFNRFVEFGKNKNSEIYLSNGYSVDLSNIEITK